MIIFWQRMARVIVFEKLGLNHHILEKMCDVTPVTDGGMKVENRVVSW